MEVVDKNISERFPVKGMSCASCAGSVESILGAQKGVVSAKVNFASHTVGVEYNPEEVSPGELRQALQKVGFDMETEAEAELIEEEKLLALQKLKRKTLFAFIFSFPVFVIGMFFHHSVPYAEWIMFVLSTPVLFVSGKAFYVNAAKQAKYLRANMDTLVALSTGIAFIYSAFNTIFPDFMLSRGLEPHVYFEAAAVIIAFILLGRYLEEQARAGTSEAIKKLMGLQPKTVRVIRNGEELTVSIKDVMPGDLIAVKPGDRIPIDGVISEGYSAVNESMITGEPLPVEKVKGDHVFAGTLNQKGSFVFRAEKAAQETFLAQIIEMVKKAQGSKAPVQKLVDKVAGVFVPIVLAIAVLTFLVWLGADVENNITYAILSLITVLIIACPCALGLATPTAIMAGIGKGAENGILIRDAETLQLAKKATAVVLDKTGTITKGEPEISGSIWKSGIEDTTELEGVLLSAELSSGHPLAEALAKGLSHAKPVAISDFENLPGAGIGFYYGGKKFFAGNEKLMRSHHIQVDRELEIFAAEKESAGNSLVYFSNDVEVMAVFSLADTLKEGVREEVARLKLRGMKVYMLTGDNKGTADKIAAEAGIDSNNVIAEVLPGGKEQFVQQLKSQGETVVMVGDGINDSQALARADVSIAMGKGSDIAMDVAAITLMSSDISLLSKSLKLSSHTMATIKQNLFWAFIYNVIAIPIAAGLFYPFTGYLLNPMVAGAAMAFSSVSVVSNSLRLKYRKI
ncbi:heavy metal translocating P-type ATPase [Cytophagaceae bacterium ABcell3]|nr:heavy metal translocating P-type ATPase [Cytophagaceae bacterium ABcell3]